MICGSLTYYAAAAPDSFVAGLCATKFALPVLAAALAALLVCELPMFAMKFGKDIASSPATRMKRTGFAAGIACIVIAVAVLRADWSLAVLLTFLYYILMNLVFAAVEKGK